MRLLILGGTSEARSIAQRLQGRPGVEIVSSLAGRLRKPQLPVGEVRVGGFEGSAGLAGYLRAQRVDVLIDATHPFAATISAHAGQAAAMVGCRLIRLTRPGWQEGAGDDWTRVPDVVAAATFAAQSPPGVVFLTIGRRDLAAFSGDVRHDYLLRAIEAPALPLPPRSTVVLGRGPFFLDGELALLREHAVGLLICKDTGGTMTAPKLEAARRLSIPVVVVDRPALEPDVAGRPVATVDEALEALEKPEERDLGRVTSGSPSVMGSGGQGSPSP